MKRNEEKWKRNGREMKSKDDKLVIFLVIFLNKLKNKTEKIDGRRM